MVDAQPCTAEPKNTFSKMTHAIPRSESINKKNPITVMKRRGFTEKEAMPSSAK